MSSALQRCLEEFRSSSKVHADKKNGRITLSTKEFEDDDHASDWLGS